MAATSQADPCQVVRVLGYHGLTVALAGERLAVEPRARITPELRRFIGHFQALLIAYLATERRLAEMTANILALSTGERRQYRSDVQNAPPGDPHRAHDREALKRAVAVLRARQTAQEIAA